MLSAALLTAVVASAPVAHLKLAAPGFSVLEADPKLASFLSDHFANQLSLHGVVVITASEISALVGLERQKELMGCGEDTSCLAELGDALGAQGVITGTLAKFGNTVQINLKIIHSRDGSPLAVASLKTGGEEAMLEELSRTAAQIAPDILRKTGREPRPTVSREVNRPKNVLSANVLSSALGWLEVEYERTLGDYFGVFIGGTYMLPYALDTTGYQVVLGGRLYFTGTSPAGFHLQGSMGYADGSNRSSPLLSGGSLFVRALLGYAWLLFGNSLQFAMGLGGGYNFTGGVLGALVPGPNGEMPTTASPFAILDLRFTFGFAF